MSSHRNLLCSLTFIFLILKNCAAAQQQQKKQNHHPSAMVVGTVYCDTCFQQEFTKSSHFIPGASVTIECCSNDKNSLCFRREAKTNQHGMFRIRLPLEISKSMEAIKSCAVELVRSSELFCSVAASATSAGLHLKSRRNGTQVFSAGFFTFKPLKQPEICYQKPEPLSASENINSLSSQKRARPAFFLPIPQIPLLPSPPLTGGIPQPPNPLQPPPSLLPPLPNIPPPPNIPPLPVLTPPPPPPALRFPPIPFPPIFPGNPPAAPSYNS